MSGSYSIAVVDDDESLGESLQGLLRALGFGAAAFSSAAEFLRSPALATIDCLILDICMPGMSGPELQRELARLGYQVPIIFITAHLGNALIAKVVADGAVECLLKPFEEESLLRAINKARAG